MLGTRGQFTATTIGRPFVQPFIQEPNEDMISCFRPVYTLLNAILDINENEF